MKQFCRCVGVLIMVTSFGYAATGGTISGTVKDPRGAPFRGAFVKARNVATRMTVDVLSDAQGRYQIRELPPGEYEVQAKTVGYTSEPHKGLNLKPGESESVDFALQKGMVQWSDLSTYQGKMLLPESTGKKEWVTNCFTCHQFQTQMAARHRDEAGWKNGVNYMLKDFGFFPRFRGFSSQRAADVTTYLASTFGLDSNLPRSPAELPRYNEVRHPQFSEDAMRIVYVDYELPPPVHFPGAGVPDKDGNIWSWQFNVNRLTKLDPRTGKVEEWPVPNPTRALIHSVTPTADGTVWFTEANSWVNKIGKFDPVTQKVTEYQDPQKPGEKHTCVVDRDGNVWSTGVPLSRFDPKTEKFTEYREVPSAYGIDVDQQGNVWFAEFEKDGKIGKVDPKTGKVTKWMPPTLNAFPRRLKIDPQGMVWFAEYQAGKIARFNPKTHTFKEYDLPGAAPTPYALGLDRKNHIWYSSFEMDVIGQLDPSTGKVVEYPFPYAENGMRDFFMDNQGRMWWGSMVNNRLGYFIPLAGNGTVPPVRKAPVEAFERPASE